MSTDDVEEAKPKKNQALNLSLHTIHDAYAASEYATGLMHRVSQLKALIDKKQSDRVEEAADIPLNLKPKRRASVKDLMGDVDDDEEQAKRDEEESADGANAIGRTRGDSLVAPSPHAAKFKTPVAEDAEHPGPLAVASLPVGGVVPATPPDPKKKKPVKKVLKKSGSVSSSSSTSLRPDDPESARKSPGSSASRKKPAGSMDGAKARLLSRRRHTLETSTTPTKKTSSALASAPHLAPSITFKKPATDGKGGSVRSKKSAKSRTGLPSYKPLQSDRDGGSAHAMVGSIARVRKGKSRAIPSTKDVFDDSASDTSESPLTRRKMLKAKQAISSSPGAPSASPKGVRKTPTGRASRKVPLVKKKKKKRPVGLQLSRPSPSNSVTETRRPVPVAGAELIDALPSASVDGRKVDVDELVHEGRPAPVWAMEDGDLWSLLERVTSSMDSLEQLLETPDHSTDEEWYYRDRADRADKQIRTVCFERFEHINVLAPLLGKLCGFKDVEHAMNDEKVSPLDDCRGPGSLVVWYLVGTSLERYRSHLLFILTPLQHWDFNRDEQSYEDVQAQVLSVREEDIARQKMRRADLSGPASAK